MICFASHLNEPTKVIRVVAELALVVLIPVFNGWEAFGQLIRDIDTAVGDEVRDLNIVAVDEPIPNDLADNLDLQKIQSIVLIRLKCNLGHQRAIAVGLAQAAQMKADAVVIMDADGEDCPTPHCTV